MNFLCKRSENMNNQLDKNEEYTKLFKSIVNRELLEDKALAALTSETLQKLNITLDRLPKQSRALLEQVSDNLIDLKFQELDPISMSLYKSREISKKLEEEYEILKLKQKNIELQMKIDHNNRFLEQMRKDLEDSKQDLRNCNPNPDDIQEFIRQLKQKLAMYEIGYETAKKNYARLNVPDAILPKSIQAQMSALEALHQEAVTYKTQADDVMFMRQTKAMLIKLRK